MDGGDAVLGSVGVMIFLPGVDQRTAEYASKRLGATRVLQSTSVDVRRGDEFDSERSSEVGRPLMDASEIRQMVKYRQAVAIISNAPPVRLSFPKYARLENPPLSKREIEFKQVMKDHAVVAKPEAGNDSLAGSSALPQSKAGQWAVASAGIAAEAEYKLTEMDELQSPLFDDGLQGWREQRK